MNAQHLHCVTGAFGYSGRYIAERLLARGKQVMTLTASPNRANPFGGAVRACPFNFEDEDALVRSLEEVKVLYNTYWIRFNHSMFQQADAVCNTKVMFRAAKRAGVQRIVHVSITNPSEDSPLEYFSGKAELERALQECGVPHTILRPAVLFGGEDILLNNIAWALRKFPIFGVFGDGQYRLQPIHVEDFADLGVASGEASNNEIINAIGPESFTYRELVEAIGTAIGVKRPLVALPPWAGYLAGSIIGLIQNDVFITRQEIAGLMADLLHVDAPAAGTTRLTDWARHNADQLGRQYHSEIARRRDRSLGYAG